MILFIAVMLLVGTTAQAADQKLSDQVDRVTKRYRNAQPIVFVEKGVTFFVYPNGEIDYKTPRRRNHRATNWNTGYYNTPGRSRNYRFNRFTVRYDYYGRVNRIGLITIGYNRLRVYYGKRGYIRHIEGNIHYTGCGYCGVDGCSITHDTYYNFNRRSKHYHDDDDDDDDDDYYYKNRKRRKKYDDDDDDDDDDD